MKDAALYARSNSLQRAVNESILHEFSHLLQWRKNGCDSILDIGCGTGDVTVDLIVPLLPSNFSRLLGCDKSDEMINYARKHNSNPKVTYDRLDISGSVDEFLVEHGLFDHAVSFFCLHWIRNQHTAMKNISKLLTLNGDCLLLFLASSNIYTLWYEMSKSSKWSPLMKDVEQFISPYHYAACPVDDLRVVLKKVGFAAYDIRIRELRHLCNSYDDFVNFHKSVNPFVHRIPTSEQEEFLNEVASRAMALNKKECFIFEADAAVVYAKK